jgi:hypothetical protein
MIHELKCVNPYFHLVDTHAKNFEIRKEDRGVPYEAGDILILRQWSKTQGYTGCKRFRKVTYALRNYDGITRGYVALSLEGINKDDVKSVLEYCEENKI